VTAYLLHVAVNSYRKNIPTLLQAIAYLRRKEMGNQQLVLVRIRKAAHLREHEISETIQKLGL